MHDTDSVGCKRLNIEGPINGESWEEAVNQKMDDWMDWLYSLVPDPNSCCRCGYSV